MPVHESVVTPEQQTTEEAQQAEKVKAVSAELVKSLDLPAEDTTTGEPIPEPTPATPAEGTGAEASGTEEATPAPAEETEEDLIPRSKVQKRIDSLTRRIKELEAQAVKPVSAMDSDQDKLERMSMEQLEAVKRQLMMAWKAETDEARTSQLLDLLSKTDKAMATVPQRFQTKQLQQFYAAVAETREEAEIDFAKASKDLFEIAQGIFQRSPSLQRSEEGQADAWRLAVDHYKTLAKSSAGQGTVKQLSQQVHTLKKKTALDTSRAKGSVDQTRLTKLRDQAMHGDSREKLQFLKEALDIEAFIPEDFR